LPISLKERRHLPYPTGLWEREEAVWIPLDLLRSWALHNTSVNRKGEDFEHRDCKGVAIPFPLMRFTPGVPSNPGWVQGGLSGMTSNLSCFSRPNR